MHRCVVLAGLAFLLLFPSLVRAAPTVTGTEIAVRAGTEFLTFASDAPIRHQQMFLLHAPERVVLDIETARGQGVLLPASYSGGVVRRIRFAQFDADTSRIVIDLARPVRAANLHVFGATLGRAPRLVIELAGTAGGGVPRPAARPAPPAAPAQKPLVMLDAGHGGPDPGAHGRSGTIEKNVTLEIARLLRRELLRTGRYRVALTREKDAIISLPDRVKIARAAKADVFVSLHADAAPQRDARGLSVYTVSETASDEESAKLAAQENASDIIAGLDVEVADKEVADILLELAQRETKNNAAKLADMLVEEMRRQGVALLRNPHRFAGFRVLKAPDIPSVLVEAGFLTNPGDEQLLRSDAYRRKLIRGVIAGVDRYVDARKSLSR